MDGRAMLRIFISYAHENLDEAKRIHAVVKKAILPHEAWLAERHMLGSTIWAKELEKRVRWCNLMVVVWSEYAKNSKYASIERQGAYEEGKPLLPCVVDGYVSDLIVDSFHHLFLKNADFEQRFIEVLEERDKAPQLPKFVPIDFPGQVKFEIASTLVTASAYKKYFTRYQMIGNSNDEFPANNVSYSEAIQYCRWLSKEFGQKISLPTVHQWELAARAGTTFEYATHDGEISPGAVNYDGYCGGTTPVESSDNNILGIFDMSGNLWEWTQTPYYLKDYYIVKGGSWIDKEENCRISAQHAFHREHANPYTGFRLVRLP